ncbi:MAG: rod shape-determining protein MreC [Acidobacteriota bacterium]|nr:MAG: rod shape-determining protein MreC [Acidobacteriota bacterium]
MINVLQRRPLVGLLLLVILNLFLLSVQVRTQDGQLLLRATGLLAITPVVAIIHAVSSGVSGTVRNIADFRTIRESHRTLTTENRRLKLEIARLRALELAVGREKRNSRLLEYYSFETLPAAILMRRIPSLADHLVINAGTRDGIDLDSAVITPEGIVGRVLVASAISSEVELLVDVNAAAGAVLDGSRIMGVVQGDGTGLLRLNFISSTENVEPGELVVSSGTDRIYPKGLPIGTVVSAIRDGVYQEIHVKPTVDYSRLDEVEVVLKKP